MNWSVAVWKQSGDDRGSLADDEKLCFRDDLHFIKEDEAPIKYVDNDHFDFRSNIVSTGYFGVLQRCTIQLVPCHESTMKLV